MQIARNRNLVLKKDLKKRKLKKKNIIKKKRPRPRPRPRPRVRVLLTPPFWSQFLSCKDHDSALKILCILKLASRDLHGVDSLNSL